MAFTLALVLGVFAPSPAAACGGFFCDNSQPVNQAAERIIFARGADGSVTAVIQIQYSGPSERFAWMLPVAGSPEISVSSDAAFAALQGATNPQYRLTTTVEGTCRDGDSLAFGPPSAGRSDAGALSDGGASSSVTVVDAGSVGPYDYVIIAVDPEATDVAAEAVDWLGTEGYDVNDFGSDRLRPYLESGMNLLAFRLTKGNDAGAIRPVVLGFGSGLPSIPIRPTAVAATDDMGVMVWVLGPHRAVPVNYASLDLNEALINWISPRSNYNDVVTRAANESGGQGFVTEMAGPAAPLADAIFGEAAVANWRTLRDADWTARHGELLSTTLNQYGSLDGVRDVLNRTLTPPAGVTLEELITCPFCYLDSTDTTIEGFDPASYLAGLETDVIDPMIRTAALFESAPYVTRFYTTMSADEMTLDPVFDYNSDLPDYSNVHNANRVIECSPSVWRSDAPWRIALVDGSVVRGAGNTWPFAVDSGELPANRFVRRIGSEGSGEVVTDNTAQIARVIRESNAAYPVVDTGGGCSVSPGSSSSTGLAWLLLAAGLVTARRRSSAA